MNREADVKNMVANRYELIRVIVNNKMGSKVLNRAKKNGISGGTVLLGRGTVSNSLMNFLSLYDEKKEIVLMAADSDTSKRVVEDLNKYLKLDKPNHGIAFTTSLGEIVGSRINKDASKNNVGGEISMYKIITTIVNRGMAEDVIEAAKAKGSKGGTIINARGSGVNETVRLFNMDIEPEKEIVMILSKEDIVDGIVESIRERLDIDKPGNGIIFIQDVNSVYGIYE